MKNLFKKNAVSASPTQDTIPGIERLSRLIAAQKALEALIETTEASVKSEAIKRFVETKSKDSFDAIEGSGKGNVQLRKRQSRSKLTDQEIAILKDKGIGVEKVVTQKESFLINPKYANDKRILNQVSKLLHKLVPDDFIIYQPEVAHYATGDDTIDETLASAPELISVVSTLAIRTSYTDAQGTIAEAIESLL